MGQAAPLAAAGAMVDIAIGVGIAVRRTAGPALPGGAGAVDRHGTLATLLLPGLWTDPLGLLMKVLPIVVLSLVALAVREDR